jgi:hypothetical protein
VFEKKKALLEIERARLSQLLSYSRREREELQASQGALQVSCS